MAGPDTSSALRRCPSCGARNRGSDGWCTLCHASLNGPPAPTVAESLAELIGEPADQAVPVPDDPEPDGAGPEVVPEPDPVLVTSLLLELAAQESGIRLPRRMAALRGLLEPGASRGLVLGVGLIGLLGVAAVVTALLAVVGLAL